MFQEASNNNNNVQFWLPEQEETEDDLLNTLSPGLSPTMLLSCDILPLVMNDGEVSLDPEPTQSTLPISPIFIAQENASKQDLMPPDLASVDLDTLLMPPEATEHKPQENEFMVSFLVKKDSKGQ